MAKEPRAKAAKVKAEPHGASATAAKTAPDYGGAERGRPRAAPRQLLASTGSGNPDFTDEGGVLGGKSGSGGGGGSGDGGGVLGGRSGSGSGGRRGDSGGVMGAHSPTRATARRQGAGYIPDVPDYRDHVIGSELFLDSPAGKVFNSHLVGKDKDSKLLCHTCTKDLPERYHLGDEHHLPDIQNQGELNACTSHAVISMLEFLIRQDGGPQINLSRMFLYRLTRRMLGWTGDTGAYLRKTIKALRFFGCPPEADWPYDASLLDAEPDAYHYAYAQNFRNISFARLDGYGKMPVRHGEHKAYDSRGEATLQLLKQMLCAGLPAAIGFPLYSSLNEMKDDFVIPFPNCGHRDGNSCQDKENGRGKAEDKLISGHAVLCVGYDDTIDSGQEKPGAVIIRNSWGSGWGDYGYAFLPYRYIEEGLAVDCWTIVDENISEIARGL
jgi:C1A family cysteine protease